MGRIETLRRHPRDDIAAVDETVDLTSADDFVPGFFETTPRMPHGLLVLSNNAAYGLLWLANDRAPVAIDQFQRIDAPLQREWGSHVLA